MLFAETFYREMRDQTFGDAVHGARKKIFDEFPQVNTWGAFQCYGDPAYKLKARR